MIEMKNKICEYAVSIYVQFKKKIIETEYKSIK